MMWQTLWVPILHLSHRKIFCFIQYHRQHVSGEGSISRTDIINLWNFFKLCIREKCTFCTYIVFRFKKFKKERHRIKMSSNCFQLEERERERKQMWQMVNNSWWRWREYRCSLYYYFKFSVALKFIKSKRWSGDTRKSCSPASVEVGRSSGPWKAVQNCPPADRWGGGKGLCPQCPVWSPQARGTRASVSPPRVCKTVHVGAFPPLSAAPWQLLRLSSQSHPGASQESYLEAVCRAPRSRNISVKAKHH